MDLSGHCADWIYLTQPPLSPSLWFLSHGQFRISSTVGLTSPSTTELSDGGWMDQKWHKGQEMGGDRNNGALGPVRWNAVQR